ncbi:hypothetical protein KSS87_019185 [Heliosperma pusillum]|nr:hypothetical protein KSS87_019185 [Heliosperma pusillum]
MENSKLELRKPLRCIVKLGGAAITCKNELEKINEENLRAVSTHLRQAMMSGQAVGMDWSTRPGQSPISVDVNHIAYQSPPDSSNFIIVHGAGSFGHFQASQSGVHKGGLNQSLVRAGFVATRISVTSLNLEIVRALAQEGIPSIGISPFSSGWTTNQRNVASADIATVAGAIDSGFIPIYLKYVFEPLGWNLNPYPRFRMEFLGKKWSHAEVLHGDAVLDHSQVALASSTEIFMFCLSKQLILYHTDVFGVYDRPPSEANAILLREIAVDEDGNWSVINPAPETMSKQVEITVAAHDTTGGMLTKISEAAAIAKLGIDVYIVKAATDHSLKALKGEVERNLPDDWLGTAIRFKRE